MAGAEAPKVGQKIRTIRQEQGHSLRDLAERSELSLNAISLIERGENSPTVSSLHLLATALGVAVADFFKPEQQASVLFVRPENRVATEQRGIRMESLGIGLTEQQLEPFLLEVAAGAGNLDQPVSHAGEEFVHCLQGSIDYCVGDRVYALGPGCSVLFDASIPHCFCNRSGQTGRMLMVFHAGADRHVARRLHVDFTASLARSGE